MLSRTRHTSTAADTSIRTEGTEKASLGCESTRNVLISAETMMVRLDAIFTAALARLRRSGRMKSGSSASPSGLKLFATSA